MGLLTSADPYSIRGGAGRADRARACSTPGATQVQKELVGEPELQAEMLTMMGRTYRRLGVVRQGAAAARAGAGERPAGLRRRSTRSVAQTLNDLGVVLGGQGRLRGRRAAASKRRWPCGGSCSAREHPDVAVTLAELGRVYQDQGLNERAEPLHREALAIRRKVLGDEHRETAVSLSDLASVLRLNGDLAGAEALLRQSSRHQRKTRGDEHPNTATTLHDLALIAATRGDAVAAESLLRQALREAAQGARRPAIRSSR